MVSYELAEGVATITLDDGKVNALSPDMLDEVAGALDQAESDEAVVVLTGRETTFTAGFDLKTFQGGDGDQIRRMLLGGAKLTERLFAFPGGVVGACNGNAIAMGSFVLLGCDHRVGAEGDFNFGLNETALGLTIPRYAFAAARHRMAPEWFDRCTVTGILIGPDDAIRAGFLDETVPHGEVLDRAREKATELAGYNRQALVANKHRAREKAIEEIKAGVALIEGEGWDW